MIIVNLKGGTGNQLFQYALGRHLAIKNQDTLKLDVDGLERANKTGDIYRPLQLDVFNIQKTVASASEIQQLKYPYGILSKAWRWLAFRLSADKNTLFRPAVLAKTGDIYLDGYWQSPKYFDDIREVLLKELTLAKPLSEPAAAIAAKIASGTSVSLHARRGDYVKNPKVLYYFGMCSQGYYEAAIKKVAAVADSPTYFVFSDDIEWVKQNLPVGANAVFVKDPLITDTEELMLMSMCNHNIIANSSFSWWGAWLNQNPTKLVVAPTPWFDHQPFDASLIPDSWTTFPKS